jgi:dienelactone hydrolase
VQVSRLFASLGYSVWVPARIGYGASGGDEDPEDTGSCATKHYEPGYRVAANQTLQVIEYAKNRPDIDGRRVIALGHSFGGMTSIAVGARNTSGIVAAVNFAGGGGANPGTRAGEPCAAEQLRQLFGAYGQSSRIPTLWIYNENDRWFGPQYTKAWFDAYRSNGGTGEYILFPPHGNDGHNFVTRGIALWRPIVESFLKKAENGAGK